MDELGKTIKQEFTSKERSNVPQLMIYISKRSVREKCYTIDIPMIKAGEFKNEKVHRLKFTINPEMLPGFSQSGVIMPQKHQKNQYSFSDFSVYFHFPNQKLTSFTIGNGFSSSITQTKYYARKYFLANIEVVKRRSRPNKPCYDGNYDEKITLDTINAIGCKPAFGYFGDIAPVCNKTQNIEFQMTLLNDELHPPPCHSIESFYEGHGEEEQTYYQDKAPPQNRSKLMIEIYFQDDHFKEITYIEEYTIESLVGTAGGYIGG